MEPAQIDKLMYSTLNLFQNKVGIKGCKFLSKVSLPLLVEIDIGSSSNT